MSASPEESIEEEVWQLREQQRALRAELDAAIADREASDAIVQAEVAALRAKVASSDAATATMGATFAAHKGDCLVLARSLDAAQRRLRLVGAMTVAAGKIIRDSDLGNVNGLADLIERYEIDHPKEDDHG